MPQTRLGKYPTNLLFPILPEASQSHAQSIHWPGLEWPPLPTLGPNSQFSTQKPKGAFQKKGWITAFPCRPCVLVLPPRLPPLPSQTLGSSPPECLCTCSFLYLECSSSRLPTAGSFSVFGSQLQHCLLRAAFPDHPVSTSRSPTFPIACYYLSSYDCHLDWSCSSASFRWDPQRQTRCIALVLSRRLIDTLELNEETEIPSPWPLLPQTEGPLSPTSTWVM